MYLSSSLTNLPNGLATCSALACSLDHYTCLFDHSLFARSYTRLYLIVRSLAGFACSLARWFEFTSLLALPYLPRSLVSVRLIARPCLRWLSHWSSTLRMHVSMLSIVSHRCMSFPLARAAALVCLHMPLQLDCTFAVSLFSTLLHWHVRNPRRNVALRTPHRNSVLTHTASALLCSYTTAFLPLVMHLAVERHALHVTALFTP
jgi:hypothetical protein